MNPEDKEKKQAKLVISIFVAIVLVCVVSIGAFMYSVLSSM